MSTAGTKGVPRAEREQQILDAAAAEIGRVGYAGMSMAEVALRAGISKPLVYGYFGTKEKLYAACAERAGERLIDGIEQVITAPLGPVEMAERTLEAIFTALAPRPHDWNVIFDRSLPEKGLPLETARRIRRTIADQAARGTADMSFGSALSGELDVSALTEVWMGTVTSLVNWWQRHPEQTPEQMAQRFARIVRTFAGS